MTDFEPTGRIAGAIAIIEKDAKRLRDSVNALQQSLGQSDNNGMLARSKCAHAAWSACCPFDDDAEIDHDLEDTALAMFLSVWIGAYGYRDKEGKAKFEQLFRIVRFAMKLDNMGSPIDGK